MKAFILVGVAVGIASLAQAGSITILGSGSEITGTQSYIYQESIAAGTQISSASISFSSIELLAGGSVPNTLFYDLINAPSTTGAYATQTLTGPGTGESYTDYFQNYSPYNGKGISDQLGSTTFTAPYWYNGHKVYDTQTWTYTFTGQALTDLQNDVLNNGYFDIGLDPNCHYIVNGSIVLNYDTINNGGHVPDQGMTAALLGVGFLGLLAFRRKLSCV